MVVFHGSQVLAIVLKKGHKRTRKGPSKLTQGPFYLLYYYMEDVLMPLIDLVNSSGNDEAILSLWLVSVSTDVHGRTFTTKNGIVSFDCKPPRWPCG